MGPSGAVGSAGAPGSITLNQVPLPTAAPIGIAGLFAVMLIGRRWIGKQR